MSGIEVAGIVLAVIPIVVESLKSASKGKVLSRRQKHVDALIHALVIQEASLSLTVKALFAKSGVTGFSEDWRALTALLKERKDIRELVEGFLEPEVFSVYTYSLGQCDKAVRDIAERIGGICGGDIAKVMLTECPPGAHILYEGLTKRTSPGCSKPRRAPNFQLEKAL